MANRIREPGGDQPFRLNPILPEGRIAQPSFGGDLWERTSAALAKAAGVFGERAKREQAAAQDSRDLTEALASSTGATTIGGGPMPDVAGDVGAIIDAAAGKYGQDAKTMRAVAQIESTGNPKAYNADSKAAGLFQFVPGTAKDYGLANPYDPAQAADAAARLMRDNRASLNKALGRDPTAGELYLAHQQGAGGAAALLKNPDKLASAVVPLDHIISNGGTADMTAGQFAKLWTSKVGGAVNVTRTAPPVRSSNPDTPFGRHAQDYWQRISVSIDADVGEIEQRFANDPAGMAQAFSELRKSYQPQILPEIQADFDAVWQRQTAPALAQAGDRAQKKLDADQQAGFLTRIDQSEAERDRAVEGYVPGSPAGVADLQRRQSEIDAQYDAASQRGYITPLQAADAKTKSRRATGVRFYERQGEALTSPEDVASLRGKLHEDYAAGKLDGIDQAGWEALDARMVALEANKRTAGNLADQALKTRADELAARVAAGGTVNQAELSKLTTDAGTAPNGETIVRGSTMKIEVAKLLRDLPVDQAEAKINALTDGLADHASSSELEAIGFGRQQIAKARNLLTTDPIGLAIDRGIITDVAPLDLSGEIEATTLSGNVADRVVKARAVAEHFGVPVRYLRPGEAKAMSATLKDDPDKVATTLTGLMNGSASAAPAIISELGETSQPIADAGRLLLEGGSGGTALDLLRGSSKSPDGKDWKSIKPEVQAPWAAETLGSAYAAQPGEMRRLKSSAALIARYRLAEQGLTPDDSAAQAIYQQALQEASGATYIGARQFGGVATIHRPGTWTGSDQVKVPADVDAGRFSDVLEAIRDGDLKTRPVDADGSPVSWNDIRSARPLAVNGGYAFVLGDSSTGDGRIFRTSDGKPWVLDLDSLLPTIAKRTVGAVRGY